MTLGTRWSLALLAPLLGFLFVLSPVAVCGEGRVPKPLIPQGKGTSCVLPTDFMRANHMLVIRDQRDRTMRRGIRTQQFSLKGCIACHAVPGDDKRPVSYDDSKHFCRACHDYTAVKIDCFQCHASRPEETES